VSRAVVSHGVVSHAVVSRGVAGSVQAVGSAMASTRSRHSGMIRS
jgi:hypothetical protein